MSGTGTSTAPAELDRRGFRVVDTDHGGYAVEVWSTAEGRPPTLWREDRIDDLLTRHEQDAPGEPLLRAAADAEIDTRAPVAEVADRLLAVARRGAGSGRPCP